jgi:hypothetical protein
VDDRRLHVFVHKLRDCPLGPREAMQFGHALHRILRKIRFANPADGPVYLLKVDVADGFYRVYVAPRDVPKLGVAFPHRDGEEPIVAFPLALPMGWTESPPYFAAFTSLKTGEDLLPHRLDATAIATATAASTRPVVFEGEHPVPPPRPSRWKASTALTPLRDPGPNRLLSPRTRWMASLTAVKPMLRLLPAGRLLLQL